MRLSNCTSPSDVALPEQKGGISRAARRDLAGVRSRAAVETAMDEALGMSFPASDPPAWGCLSGALPEASAPDPIPRSAKVG